ncbi:hypothetical protein V1517DRAFT_284191 [Lipomyces orientalis]|uniref:Uncharacterized protein n=1 Tax=Lipomyces orientalis TaxID=1233043 RepID=A0ACC3TYT0_9ASCO
MSDLPAAAVERSPADLLREKYESSTATNVTDDLPSTVIVEDDASVDLTSSVTTADTTVSSLPTSSPPSADTLSSTSATASSSANSAKKKPVKEKLDITSLEAFPTLGGGSSKTGAATSIWGSKPVSSSVTKTNGKGRTPLPVRSSDVTDIFDFVVSPQSRDRAVFAEVVTKAKDLSGVTSIESSTSKSLSTTFIVKGKPESIAVARRALVKGLTAKVVTEKISVPSSVRPFIIGTGGRNLKAIQQRTSTKIQVQKKEEVAEGDADSSSKLKYEDGEEETTDVTIEGDIDGVALAKAEILEVVAERTKNLTIRLSQVNPDYFPYFAAQVGALEEDKDVRVRVPTLYREPSDAAPAIIISGERSAVQDTKVKIEESLQELQRSYGTANTSIPKRQHRFIVGEKGKTLQEIFDLTGCVVKVPPAEDPSDIVTLVGPRARIGEAINLSMTKANSIVLERIDISKAHGKNRVHARDLTRYFKSTKRLQDIEKDSDVQISQPSSKELFNESIQEVAYDIAGKTNESVKKARKVLVDLVNSIPPVRVAHLAGIDPLLHRHIIGFKGRNLQKVKEQFGVETLIPDEADESNEIVLIYEGKNTDEFGPDDGEIRSGLESAIMFFEDIKTKQADLVTRVLTIPAKNHKFIIGPKRSTINALSGPESSVYIQLGLNKDRPSQSHDITVDSVIIRGPADEVDSVAEKIEEIVEEASNQEILNSFSVTFDFPTKFSSQLIGKGGSNISKYREELGVKIDLDDEGTVTIKGIKSNVLETQARIEALAARLADEVVLRLNVPIEHHSALIGQKGKFVKRLEERYDVRVNFPRSDELENGDASDFLPKNKDEIVIRGPSKGATKARDELLELYKYEAERGHSTTITVPKKAISRIIGRNGEFINDIMDSTGAKVDIVRKETDDDTSAIAISGTEEGIQKAKAKILEVVEEFEQFTSQIINVDKKYHKSLIGNRGAALRDIVLKSGGPDDVSQQRRIIRIPPASSSDTRITVQGNEDVVAKVIQEIQRRVAQLENQIESEVDVALEKHRFIIGPGGSTKRSIEQECGVTLIVPPQKTTRDVKIQGSPEGVEKAKARIIELTTSKKERHNGQTISSPNAAPPAEEPASEAAAK